MVGQELEEGWVYNGGPAKKFKKNRFFEDIPIEKLTKTIGDLDGLLKKYDEQYVKRQFKKKTPLKERRIHIRKEKSEEKPEEKTEKKD